MYQEHADFMWELNAACQASQPMGWKDGHSVVTLGLGANHGGPAEMWWKKRTGLITEVKHSMVIMVCLLKRCVLGVFWLAEAREQEPVLVISALLFYPPETWEGLRGSGAPHPLLRVSGWMDCLPACLQDIHPFSVGGGNPAAHKNCEIQPCVGTGCT